GGSFCWDEVTGASACIRINLKSIELLLGSSKFGKVIFISIMLRMLRFGKFFVAILLIVFACDRVGAQYFAMPQVPAKGYDVTYYKTTLHLDRAKDSLRGDVEMTAKSAGDLQKILQHAKYLTIDSVFVDGFRSPFAFTDSATGTYEITGFPPNYHNGTIFTVKTYYHGKGVNEGGTNPWGGVQNKGGMMFAMGVGFTAPYVSCTRHWMPCYDAPDDKADSATFRFFADTSGIVVSNGLQTGFLPGSGGINFYEWTVSHPIATYLMTFACGPFLKLSIPNSLNIPFDVYAFAKDTAKVRTLMTKRVAEGLVYFDSLFGPYPFEKVGYVIAPIGSMEHQTMITLVNQVFDTNNTTAVHELAHQWWGDKLTCYDFQDPWLNEGFATFSESLFLERFSSKAEYWKRQRSNIESSVGTTIPLHGAPLYTSPRNNYPGLIYSKGAAVLGMLRYILGDSVFFLALRNYSAAYAYTSITSYELEEAFSMTIQHELRWFFAKWVFGIGNPELNVLWSRNGNTANIRLEQIQDSTKIGYFRLPLIVEARTYDGKSERHEILMDSMKINQISFTNSFVPDTLVIDPDGAIIKKINGSVKLGAPGSETATQGKLYGLQFNPNPTSGKKLTLTIEKEGAKLAEKAELMIFDTNGNNIMSVLLSDLRSTSKSGAKSYSLDVHSLSGGTYFATLLFNGATIGGKGNFVVAK
ncbi:MAG: M1 family aminopeptidase, partial [Ignavibacteriota bacterium]